MLCYGYLGVGLGGVGWGNNVHVNLHTHVMLRYGDLFMSTCTHTSCYVMVIFSCTCTHTSCYVMVILGWGWVGWGGAITFMSTCTHTSCYVMVIFSCTCTHCVMLRYGYLGVGLGGVGWGNNVHVNLHTHVMLRYGYFLMDQTNAKNPFFFLSTVGTQIADRWWKGLKDYIPKSFPRRLYHGVNTKEHPELEKFVLGYCWRKSLGPLTPHRFLEELCKAVKAMKSVWEEGKKVLHPKKNTNLCQKTK